MIIRITHHPDTHVITPEVTLGDEWDPRAISELIHSKSAPGNRPCFLLLGRKEAGLLRDHLGNIFGPENVPCFKDVYYQELEVIELDCPTFLVIGGRKAVREIRNQGRHRVVTYDESADERWQPRFL